MSHYFILQEQLKKKKIFAATVIEYFKQLFPEDTDVDDLLRLRAKLGGLPSRFIEGALIAHMRGKVAPLKTEKGDYTVLNYALQRSAPEFIWGVNV